MILPGLHTHLLAALTALLHVFDEHPLTREEWLVRYWDASSAYECHLLVEMGCLEGAAATCPRDLRSGKWHGPACIDQHGEVDCRDCVLLADAWRAPHLAAPGTPAQRHASQLETLRQGCGIPCTPRLDRF